MESQLWTENSQDSPQHCLLEPPIVHMKCNFLGAPFITHTTCLGLQLRMVTSAVVSCMEDCKEKIHSTCQSIKKDQHCCSVAHHVSDKQLPLTCSGFKTDISSANYDLINGQTLINAARSRETFVIANLICQVTDSIFNSHPKSCTNISLE
jgi:hypothetical protein